MALNIIARKPRSYGGEYVVVQRDAKYHPYVSCTVTPETLAHNEWLWGNYFETLEQAMRHFEARGK